MPNTCMKWYNELLKQVELKKKAAFVKTMRQASEGRSTGGGAPTGHTAVHSMTHDTSETTGISFEALMGGTGGVDLDKKKHQLFVIPEHIDDVLASLLSSNAAKFMFEKLDGTGVVGKMTAYVPQTDRKPVMATGAAAAGGAEREVTGVVSGGTRNQSVGMFIYFKVGDKGGSEYLHLQTCFPIADQDIQIGKDGARVEIIDQAAGGGAGVGALTIYKFEWLGSETPTQT